MFEKTLMLTSANGSKANLYESLRQTGAATLIESLQSQLKMKEGEITQLQVRTTPGQVLAGTGVSWDRC